MRLDIVMPAHNEEDRIDRTLRAYRSACPDHGVRFLVALDSCTDRTPDIVHAHEREDDRVRSFEYPKLGKGGVIAETFPRSDAELVGFVDADGSTPPRSCSGWPTRRHTDGAIASRRHPAPLLPARRPCARITSSGFAGTVRGSSACRTATPSAGPRSLRRHVVRTCSRACAARDLLFDVDLLALAREPASRRRGPDGVDRPGGLARERAPTPAGWSPRCCACGCAAGCSPARRTKAGPMPTPTSP